MTYFYTAEEAENMAGLVAALRTATATVKRLEREHAEFMAKHKPAHDALVAEYEAAKIELEKASMAWNEVGLALQVQALLRQAAAARTSERAA